MAKTVSALYGTVNGASTAVERLVSSGFARDDISLLMSDASPGRRLGVKEGTKAAEGTAAGAAAGGAIGAIAAGLLAVGTGGVGLLAAGPLVSALAGLGAGGTLGGIIGASVGASVPEHEVKLYGDGIEAGGVLVGLQVHDDRVDLAKEVLSDCGGEHVRVH